MRDEEIEVMLRRYRVAEASADLGERISLRRSSDWSGHVWGAIAAAATLALWIATHAAMWKPAGDPIREAEVSALAEVLGGGEDARRYAETVVPEREPQVELPVLMESAP